MHAIIIDCLLPVEGVPLPFSLHCVLDVVPPILAVSRRSGEPLDSIPEELLLLD